MAVSANDTTSIEVEIYGSRYQVRAAHDRAYLEELAAMVDRKMREISGRIQVVDAGRLAILSALNLADELYQCTKQQESERDRIMERLAELEGELAEALEA